MTVALMALAGIAAGFVVDELIARLAREPYERGEVEEDDLRLKSDPSALDLASETGAFNMPAALTRRSAYRRIAVVAATALLFALVGLRYEGDALHLAIVAGYVAALLVCTGTDVLAFRVPNVITYPAILAAIVIGMTMSDVSIGGMWAGGLVTGGTFLAMSIATRGGMGMGDVKLAFFVGFALGLSLGVVSMLITAIGGGVIAVLLMVTRLRSRRDPIPYAPFISLGAVYVMLMHGTAFVEL
jgi:prepilin signal peptidase PulO-like enzyme (type II secretory pathway)